MRDPSNGRGERSRDRPHRVLNVYHERLIETVENAIGMAKQEDDVESVGEALGEISAAYTGVDFRETDTGDDAPQTTGR